MSDFVFYTRFNQVELLAERALNVRELLEKLRHIPDASIYYHTHKFLQEHHFISPEPSNDFAHWVADVLNEKQLGEEIGSVDIIQYRTIQELRERFIDILEEFIDKNPVRDAPKGREFHFMSCKTFILPTPIVAHNLYEFRLLLEKISLSSLYFHIYEARLRLKQDDTDFSRWIRDEGNPEIADEISRLDPYTYSLEGIRKKIISIIDKHLIK